MYKDFGYSLALHYVSVQLISESEAAEYCARGLSGGKISYLKIIHLYIWLKCVQLLSVYTEYTYKYIK